MATLSFQPKSTFEAVSSSGRRARKGTSAVCVGRVIVSDAVTRAASA